jgi:hypothetical protein
MKLFRAHRGLKAGLALAGSLLLLSQSAHAHHGSISWSVSPNGTNAYGNISSTTQYGADEPLTGITELPTGWLIAHQVSSPASPITPIPNDEEEVGNGTAWALWWHTFCSQDDLNMTITWESDMTGAPSVGAGKTVVAHLTTTAAGIFNTDTWVIRNGTNDYDLYTPNYPTSAICSSTTDGLTTLFIDAELPSGRRVAQNPSTTGNAYLLTTTYTDTTDVNHTITSNSVTIS